MKRLIFIFLVFFATLFSASGYAATDSALFDTGTVNIRIPVNTTIENYKNNSDFDYSTNLETDIGWWERFKNWLKDILGFDDISEESITVMRVVFWLLIIAAVIGLIYLLFKNEFTLLFSKKTKSQNLNAKFIDIATDTVTLENLLKDAIAQKNYTEAIRLYYTLSLKTLADNNYISLRIDKTNNEYLFELPNGVMQQPFKQLTFYFDYIFYGQFTATETIFLKMQENYTQLLQNLKTKPAR